MRIAVISDIHGNVDALEAVLADISDRRCDGIVNLGDICSGPLFPAETADRLMALDLPTVAGNHERQLLETSRERMGPSDRYAAERLGPDHLAWLAGLPATLSPLAGIQMAHGTPASDVQYFLETVTADGLRRARDSEILDRAGSAKADVLLCGHSHLPRAVKLADGRLIVNPGSVGLPAYDDDRPFPHVVETGSPDARYAIVFDDEGIWAADFHSVTYDWQQAAKTADANGRADWARALRTGRV